MTRRTAELLRRLIQQAATAQKKRSGKEGPYYYLPNISVDELLYWDALQRLGELPEGVK